VAFKLDSLVADEGLTNALRALEQIAS